MQTVEYRPETELHGFLQSLKMEPQFPTLKLGNRELFIGHTMYHDHTIPTGDRGQNGRSVPLTIMSETWSHLSYKVTEADLK